MIDDAPRWRRRKTARPAEIIEAALSVFAENGFAAARLDEIARRAGVSKGALYLYFETKEDLFRAVVRAAVAPNLEGDPGRGRGLRRPVRRARRRCCWLARRRPWAIAGWARW